jgi:serine/threonine protein kinase
LKFQQHLGEARLSERDTASVVRQVIEAVGFIHSRGVVHRDIQPDNILLREPSEMPRTFVVKVVDFGHSAIIAEDKRSANGDDAQVLKGIKYGSQIYAAPEIIFEELYNNSIGMVCWRHNGLNVHRRAPDDVLLAHTRGRYIYSFTWLASTASRAGGAARCRPASQRAGGAACRWRGAARQC